MRFLLDTLLVFLLIVGVALSGFVPTIGTKGAVWRRPP